MEIAKNSLLTDIIDILSINGQQENLENLISDLEKQFIRRGKSTKNLLNKIEDCIKIGTDLGLIAENADNNTIRLKFNPYTKPSIAIGKLEDAENINDDDNESDYAGNSEDDFNKDEFKVSDSDKEYEDGIVSKVNSYYSTKDQLKSKMRNRSISIIPNSYPSTSNSYPSKLSIGALKHFQPLMNEKTRKRKNSDENYPKRTRRKY